MESCNIIAPIRRIIVVMWIAVLLTEAIFSQPYASRNNYTGAWETPASWNPIWAVPQTSLITFDITINGYITLSSSLSFSTTASNLIINDTLVIKGDLLLGNNNDVTVNNNGILIVWGNLTINNQSEIISDGYLIVTGNLIKNSSVNQGSFTSNDNPVKVFIGGTISSVGITDNNPNYPAINEVAPTTIPYPNTASSYGNMTDLQNDPVFAFFQSTCTIATAGSNSPVCAGSAVNLTSTGGTSYTWTGPNGFTSNLQSPSIPNATDLLSGLYTVTVTASDGSTDTAMTEVIVNALPEVIITSSNSPLCTSDILSLKGNPAGGTFTLIDGPGTINGDVLTATGSGTINLEYNYADVCANKATQSILVNDIPVANAGPDQELQFVFETLLSAQLLPSETGEWSLLSGSGFIDDIHLPTTTVSELSTGENKFLWKVGNGGCEASDEVIINVIDVFVPSVITPNGDDRNDYFKVSEISGKVELIVFNRWGKEEFASDHYANDWDGINNKGVKLPNDTYFYILKFENGTIRKGSVLIKR
ncbi:MAG: gliding motility-associated C-terminal domain-containing protein [Bacteroidales bacterium]|nr:gliding motility-associated C-terminal domain-containing protein [Bacteroidales bacterium]